jgi:hypothetical protein
MQRRAIAALAVAVAVAGLMPATAAAYVIGGRPWPTTTIRYYASTSDYAAAAVRAARIWNRANVGIRFARTAKRSKADVVIAHGGKPCTGETKMGFNGAHSSATVVHLGAGCHSQLITLTAVHELGHVLGLDHELKKCARMDVAFTWDGTPVRCGDHTLTYWLAHPLTGDDISGARAMYSR